MSKKVDVKIYRDSFKWNYEAYPFFCSVYQKISTPVSRKYYVNWDVFINSFQNDHLYAFLPKEDIIKNGNKIIKELLSGDDNFLKFFKQVHKEIQSAIKICLKFRAKKNFHDLEGWWLLTQQALSHAGQLLFSFDYTLDNYLKDLQQKSPRDFANLNDCLRAEKPSFIDEANTKILELSKKYGKDFDKIYEIFISEFGWFQNSYKGVFRIKKAWLKNYLKEIKKERKRHSLKTKINLAKNYKLLAETAKLGITFRDDKKKLLLIAVELMDEWLKNICRENNWKLETLRWLSLDEILALSRGERKYTIRAKKYASRGERLGMLTQIGYDDITKKYWDKIYSLNSGDKDIKKIKGVIANKGAYKGVAKIITNIKEGGKFKKGEVLVTSMTRPEYLLLIKKSGAIITDEGGITCHAAIVSRELKIPCIIGTKVATQVLHDGDLVEVDAERGVVKILKKAK